MLQNQNPRLLAGICSEYREIPREFPEKQERKSGRPRTGKGTFKRSRKDIENKKKNEREIKIKIKLKIKLEIKIKSKTKTESKHKC